MPLAALIIASEDGHVADGLPAILPLAGQTLFAYQVRMAHAAGARHIVALVDQMPSSLVAALDTLREDGIGIEIARDARDAADRVHPDERVLLMAGPVVADGTTIGLIAESANPVLLCLSADLAPGAAERIDSETCWSGLALIDGRTLRDTASMVGDWALGSTVMRTALQQGATRILGVPKGGHLSLPQTADDASLAARELAGQLVGSGGRLAERIFARALALVTPRLVSLAVPWSVYVAAPVALYAVSIGAGLLGFLPLAMFVFIIASLALRASQLVGLIGGRQAQLLNGAEAARLPLAMVLLALAGWDATLLPGGWGPLALSAWSATGLALAALPGPARLHWFPEPEGMIAILMVALLAHQPVAGLLVCTVYGVAAQIMRSRLAERI